MGTETGQVTSPTVVAGTLSECNDFSLSATVRAATCGVANFQATRDHKTVEKAASKERQLVVNVDIIEQPMPITIVEKIATAIVLDEDEVPDDFKKVTMTESIDKMKAKKILTTGAKVPGLAINKIKRIRRS